MEWKILDGGLARVGQTCVCGHMTSSVYHCGKSVGVRYWRP